MVNSFLIFALVTIAIVIFCFLIIITKSNYDFKKQIAITQQKIKGINPDIIKETISNNNVINNIGSRLSTKDQNILFRKSGNPWGISYEAWLGIRYGGLALGLLLGLVFLFLLPIVGIAFFIIGAGCFIIPKSEYEKVIKEREIDYAKMYEVLWVLANNLSFSEAATACRETKSYLEDHPNTGKYLVELFDDLAENFSGEEISPFIKEKYGDYPVPIELAEILITSYQTGTYPKPELNALQEMLENDMDTKVNSVLTQVASKATFISTPAMLLALFVVAIFPMLFNILQQLM